MADVRKLVTIDSAGTVTTVKDLEVSSSYQAVRGSFAVKAPDRQTAMVGSGRRYAGQGAVAESHQNGEVSWKALVKGATSDVCLQNVESMIAAFEQLEYPGLHLEWRPDGATYSTYYEVRGPAKWQPAYDWAQFQGAGSMLVAIAVPVAPLARGANQTISVSSFTAPNVVQLGTAVGGTAPARVQVGVGKASGQAGPAFGLLGWWQRLSAPPAGYNAPFGMIEAETVLSGSTNVVWASAADAGSRGGNRLQATASGAQTATSRYGVSTAGLAGRNVELEIFARVYVPTTLVSPRIVASFYTDGGAGSSVFTREWGAAGRPISVPSSSGYRLTRVGTVSLPLSTAQLAVESKWVLKLDMSWAAGSSGTVGLDWIALVPAGQRACSPTGEPLDSAYPRFMPSGTNAATKTVTPDLAGMLTTSGATNAADTGLGGSVIEVPPGNVDMLVLLSEQVPDEPSSGNLNGKEWTGTTMSLSVIPRYFLVRGS